MSQKVKCPVCNIEYDIRGFPTHYGTKHPVEFAKSIGSQPNTATGVSLQDSAKIGELSDVVKAKDTQIAQLQDSLTKSDAAFLTVKAELAQLNDRPVSDGMVLDFINNRIDEDTWQKIGKIKQFGLATVEDSAELGDKVGVEDIHESFVNGQREQAVKQIKRYGAYDFFDDYKRYLESSNYPMGEQFMYFTDATGSYLKRTGKGKLKDTPQPEDELKPVNPAPATETTGTIPPPPETTVTAQVADVKPESPGEKWWREFQEGLNK